MLGCGDDAQAFQISGGGELDGLLQRGASAAPIPTEPQETGSRDPARHELVHEAGHAREGHVLVQQLGGAIDLVALIVDVAQRDGVQGGDRRVLSGPFRRDRQAARQHFDRLVGPAHQQIGRA